MAKPNARYTFSGVNSISFTTYDVSFRFSDGDSLSVDFAKNQGLKMLHEECRDFLKWYGKRDMSELKETYKVIGDLIAEQSKEDLESSRK